MTCIVGLVDEDKVLMGADSAASTEEIMTVRADQKMFRNEEFLFGCTSSWRMAQLLRYSLKPPVHHPDVSVEAYLHTDFIDAIRSCFKDGGYAKVENGVEEGGVFLLAYRGGIYSIYQDFQIETPADGYMAIGSGYLVALGSLYSSRAQPASSRVLLALQAAEHLCPTVRAPFHLDVL